LIGLIASAQMPATRQQLNGATKRKQKQKFANRKNEKELKMKKIAETFDAALELLKIQQARKILRPRRVWRKSKLDKFSEELFSLRELGATGEEMRLYLRKYRGVVASRPTIYRIFHPRTTCLTTRLGGRSNVKTAASKSRKK